MDRCTKLQPVLTLGVYARDGKKEHEDSDGIDGDGIIHDWVE